MEEEDEAFLESLAHTYDISDIKIDLQRNKTLSKLYLILKSEEPINLMRFYLSMKNYLFQIEQELGVLDETEDMH